MDSIYRAIFHTFRYAATPFGSLRSSSPFQLVYEKLARKAYPHPDSFFWFRNCWGHNLHLSYSWHIDRQILIYGTYDRPLHNAIEQRVMPGMVCMDIGANLGEMTLHMASRAAPSGVVFSFEPVPQVYKRLVSHISSNGFGGIVSAFDIALSNRNGPVRMAIADLDTDNQALGSIVAFERDELTRNIEVQCMTLDTFVSEYALKNIDFMKVDIQGAEWFLLEGGSRVLTDMGPDLLIELSPFDLKAIGKDSRQLCEFIESFGYKIFTLNADGTPGRRLDATSIAPELNASNVFCSK